MSKKLIGIICGVLLIYIGVHWYIAVRLSQLLSPVSPAFNTILQVFIIALGFAYPAGRLANMRLPGIMGDRLIIIGSYWIGAVFYTFLALLILDAVALLDRHVALLPDYLKPDQPPAGWLVIIVALTAVVAGSINAGKFRIRRLTLNIDKFCQVNPLTIVSVSDMHLGLLVGPDRLKQLTAVIQQLKPDLILLPGDIIDETVGVFADCRMADDFRRLSPRFGIYGCLGSHEYIWGSAEKAMYHLGQAGITLLRDEYTVVSESFVLAGRDDVSRRRFAQSRRELTEVLQEVDRSLPLILLDHTPGDINAGPRCEVDLQLFGHTHGGQIFPFNLFTRLAFPLNWGYAKIGNCHTYVSSGFGVWGTPLRIGSKAEVLYITLHFSKNER